MTIAEKPNHLNTREYRCLKCDVKFKSTLDWRLCSTCRSHIPKGGRMTEAKTAYDGHIKKKNI